MKLGLNLSDKGAALESTLPAVVAAEHAGFDSVWLGEAYGSDAVTTLGYFAARTEHIKLGSAVMQMHARTPAMTAMTAMTLDHLSSGRFLLGLGVSGPQVIEGWHGVAYGKPLGLTREYVDVVRAVIAREAPVTHAGEHLQIPFTGAGSTGLGRPLRTTLKPDRSEVPIYLAAIGPKNIELTGEIADGWLPLFYSPVNEDVLWAPLHAGLGTSGRDRADLDIVAAPPVEIGPDIEACRQAVKPTLALYIGGMGARGKNFYFDLVCRYGYEAQATVIQDHFLAGRKDDAVRAVPDSLVDEVALVGPIERVIEQLDVWRQSRVTTVCLRTTDVDVIEHLAKAMA